MEGEELCRELQRHLDRVPVPYPPTESGVEIRILEQFLLPKDARPALCLSAIPEPLEAIHGRTPREIGREQLGEALDRMVEEGSIRMPVPSDLLCGRKAAFTSPERRRRKIHF